MRILHLASEYPPQQVFGLGRYVCDLSREMVSQDHEVHVLTNSMGGKDQDVLDHGVHVHRVDFPPPPKPPNSTAPVLAFNLHIQERFTTLGRKAFGEPEVLVSHDWLTAIAGYHLSRRMGVPHVWTVHDTVQGKRLGCLDEESDRHVAQIERWAGHSAERVLVNSRAVQAELEKVYGVEESRISLLHCGVDPARFITKQPRRRVQAFRQIFAQEDEILITYTGRLDVEKGIDTLINAFARVHMACPQVRLAIVGQGILREQIEAHIMNLRIGEFVKLYGYLSGEVLKHTYLVSDLHVCPSYYEPFGIVALEAMAAGAPIVASATGGLVDIISSKELGRTFPPGNTEALAEVIIKLVRNPGLRKRLGRAGQKHVKRNFAWSRIAQEAARLYSAAQQGKAA